MDLVLSELQRLTPDRLPVEIVQRKGVGHPDTICDALAEKLSGALSKFYQQRFGRVLHHNVDKVLLRAGAARPAFGGGVPPAELQFLPPPQGLKKGGPAPSCLMCGPPYARVTGVRESLPCSSSLGSADLNFGD